MVRRAIQLYSVESLDEPLPQILRRVARYGYEGVEFGPRFWKADVNAVASALEETGLAVVGLHSSLKRLETDLELVVNRCRAIGSRDVVVPHLPARFFRTASRVESLGERLNDLGRTLIDRGLQLHYHNQVHDFMALANEPTLGRLLVGLDPVGGRRVPDGPFGHTRHRVASVIGTLGDLTFEQLYQRGVQPDSTDLSSTAYGRLLAATDPGTVRFELDVGAAAAAGYGMDSLAERIGPRASLLHLKDVAPTRPHPTNGQHSVRLGTGIVQIDRVVEAARRWSIDWLIYEHEQATDPIRVLDVGATAFDEALGGDSDRPGQRPGR